MQSDRDIMQQALGYMESVGQMDMYPEEWAIVVALRSRLAQPEQKPVSGVVLDRHGFGALVKNGAEDWHCKKHNARRLYTAPPQGIYYTPPQRKPEQEPVATVRCINGITIGYLEVMQPVGTKLYTTPPQRKPLTDEEIEFIYADTGYNDIQMFARAIEAKLKEKNT